MRPQRRVLEGSWAVGQRTRRRRHGPWSVRAGRTTPAEFVDQTSLLGPVERVADRMAEFATAGVTTLTGAPFGSTLEDKIASLAAAMDALQRSGAAE